MSIVVGYIPTAEGEAALDRAIEESSRRQQRLVVINSSRGESLVDNRFIQPDQAVTLQDRLQESGISFELLQPVGGNDAAQEVLTTAEENQADLIVIGLRKRSAVGKMILGSTAQRILLQATCDVLAVKVRQD